MKTKTIMIPGIPTADLRGSPKIVCIDSASLVNKDDVGQVVITDSHGGLIRDEKEKAFNVQAVIAFFNDAGIGIDQSRAARIETLDE